MERLFSWLEHASRTASLMIAPDNHLNGQMFGTYIKIKYKKIGGKTRRQIYCLLDGVHLQVETMRHKTRKGTKKVLISAKPISQTLAFLTLNHTSYQIEKRKASVMYPVGYEKATKETLRKDYTCSNENILKEIKS